MLTLDFAQRLCNTFLGIKKALTLRKCLIYLVPGGEVESPHTFVRWILRTLAPSYTIIYKLLKAQFILRNVLRNVKTTQLTIT